jgi:hypothetical protein
MAARLYARSRSHASGGTSRCLYAPAQPLDAVAHKLLTQVLTHGTFWTFLLPARKHKTHCYQRVQEERMKGLEPSTFCMASRRSTN